MMSGCASQNTENTEFYTAAPNMSAETIARIRISPPPSSPIVERSAIQDPTETTQLYAERGYSAIGMSVFKDDMAHYESSAMAQAKALGADLVLMLSLEYTTEKTVITPAMRTYSHGTRTTTTFGSATYQFVTVTAHKNSALYFVKTK